ncbi:histidine phosphatase family protein [Ferroplasma sp. Type II]|uniref:histidine phosphatase family protein n=1 Tax=Ferroplasma sp. Type II TaxID=261388 RepID=UPI0025BCA938|nr:histidine phosphatase family protein [Ferroplasma sp. Type II]
MEKFSELKKRVKNFIDSISQMDYNSVLVATHLEPIRGMFSLATEINGLPLTKLEIGNCSISVFSMNNGNIELKGFNWLPLQNYNGNKNKSFY